MKNQIVTMLLIFISTTTYQNARAEYFGVISDHGQFGKSLEYLRKDIRKYKEIKQLIMPGDNVPDDKSMNHAEIWDSWKKDFQFYAVANGNHGQGPNKEIAYFNLPGEYYSRVSNNGSVKTIVLNSNNVLTVEAQRQFLINELETSKHQFIFVTFHHPPVAMRKLKAKEKSNGSRINFNKRILPVIKRYQKKITALFTGHYHQASVVSIGTLPMFLSAATYNTQKWEPVNYIDKRGYTVKTRWINKKHSGRYWLHVRTNIKRNDVVFKFIRIGQTGPVCTVKIDSKRKMTFESDCSASNRSGKPSGRVIFSKKNFTIWGDVIDSLRSNSKVLLKVYIDNEFVADISHESTKHKDGTFKYGWWIPKSYKNGKARRVEVKAKDAKGKWYSIGSCIAQ